MNGEGASFRFHCPACGRALTAPDSAIGKRATCPLCKVSITIPSLPATPCGDPAGDVTTTEILAVDHVPLATAAIPNGDPADWRKLVQTHREFVPLIECPAGVGSGLLISGDGLVVTNRHVIDGAKVFMMTFYDGSKAKAVTIHTHSHRDLAIVRAAIRRDKHFDIAHAVADEPQAGDDVLAIGHPRGFAFTSTRGIVSETRRRLADGLYVQTDVAINPGNSGGPLLDSHGNLVGINTRTQLDSQGLGFAILGQEVQDYALYVIDLIQRGEVHVPSDDDIAKIEKAMTPWDIASAGVQASGLRHRLSANATGQQCLTVKTAAGGVFTVTVGGNVFRVAGAMVSGLKPAQLRNPELLVRLLGWQNELCGPAFEITGDTLLLGYKRSVEGLDVNEAREAILRVADAMDALNQPVRKFIR
jgi:S1-C subfamily serine protease